MFSAMKFENNVSNVYFFISNRHFCRQFRLHETRKHTHKNFTIIKKYRCIKVTVTQIWILFNRYKIVLHVHDDDDDQTDMPYI